MLEHEKRTDLVVEISNCLEAKDQMLEIGSFIRATLKDHRGFLESPGPQNSFDHLNAMDRQSASTWLVQCMQLHASMQWFYCTSWLSVNAFKGSQKIPSTKEWGRSLENLYVKDSLLVLTSALKYSHINKQKSGRDYFVFFRGWGGPPPKKKDLKHQKTKR